MRVCSIEGCEEKHCARDYCKLHYKRIITQGKAPDYESKSKLPCSVPDCGLTVYGLGYCSKHYERFKRHGDPLGGRKLNGVGWSKYTTKRGYVVLYPPNLPPIPEHRYVMEQTLGRTLLPNENVHHLNGVKNDNRPENLELWVTSQPCGQRVEDLVKWAKEILEKYDS